MKITKEKLSKIIKEEILSVLEAYDPEEYATEAGLDQDIDVRRRRGSFDKGDWGIHGDGGYGAEYSDYGEYPWIQDAKAALADEAQPDKLKAIEALANELGVSVSFRPFEPLEESEKDYPNNSTMKKLVGQAKMDGRYKENDPEKLKKDYDKHVRDTRRDPKYNRKGK